MLPHMSRIPVKDHELAMVQDAVTRVLYEITRRPEHDSVLLGSTAIATAATGTSLTHGLGHTPQGWEIVDQDADSRIWRLSWDATKLTLRASDAVNAAVLVW
jgi:hypothetical protein